MIVLIDDPELSGLFLKAIQDALAQTANSVSVFPAKAEDFSSDISELDESNLRALTQVGNGTPSQKRDVDRLAVANNLTNKSVNGLRSYTEIKQHCHYLRARDQAECWIESECELKNKRIRPSELFYEIITYAIYVWLVAEVDGKLNMPEIKAHLIEMGFTPTEASSLKGLFGNKHLRNNRREKIEKTSPGDEPWKRSSISLLLLGWNKFYAIHIKKAYEDMIKGKPLAVGFLMKKNLGERLAKESTKVIFMTNNDSD